MNRALSSQISFAAGDLPNAIHFAREAIVLDPEFWIGHFQLAQAYVHLQQNDQAMESLNQANRFSAGNSKRSLCAAIFSPKQEAQTKPKRSFKLLMRSPASASFHPMLRPSSIWVLVKSMPLSIHSIVPPRRTTSTLLS